MSEKNDNLLRLNKLLAQNMGISRREADDLINNGNVSINGLPARIGSRASANDQIKVNGKEIATNTVFQYLILNKPVGYVCSRKKQGENPTIYELLPANLHSLKTVGRLDKDSSGLIMLTNDGNFTFEMTHPKFYKVKRYEVKLDKELQPLHQQMISDFGINLEDGPSKLTLERMSDDNRYEWIVIMSEGRNRQIRRTFNSLGYEVTNLHRTNFGNYPLGDILPGKYKVTNIR